MKFHQHTMCMKCTSATTLNAHGSPSCLLPTCTCMMDDFSIFGYLSVYLVRNLILWCKLWQLYANKFAYEMWIHMYDKDLVKLIMTTLHFLKLIYLLFTLSFSHNTNTCIHTRKHTHIHTHTNTHTYYTHAHTHSFIVMHSFSQMYRTQQKVVLIRYLVNWMAWLVYLNHILKLCVAQKMRLYCFQLKYVTHSVNR